MQFKMINNQMFELLEVLKYDQYNTHYIVRQSEEAFLYPGQGNYTFDIADLESEMETIKNETWIDEEIKNTRIDFFKNAIGIMRKHNRNVIIDDLIHDRKRMNLEGVSTLVFAC